jgi:hypothetical protein
MVGDRATFTAAFMIQYLDSTYLELSTIYVI